MEMEPIGCQNGNETNWSQNKNPAGLTDGVFFITSKLVFSEGKNIKLLYTFLKLTKKYFAIPYDKLKILCHSLS